MDDDFPYDIDGYGETPGYEDGQECLSDPFALDDEQVNSKETSE